MRKRYLVLASAILISTVLSSAISTVSVQSNGGYDPWIDLNDDGAIDIFDIVAVALAFGASGTPINKTALLLDLEARVDALNASLIALQQLGSVHVESGEFDGVVNSDMVELMGVTTINFDTAFTSTAKPQMVISVVLKGAANGLVEGAAIKAVEDVKGATGIWTGFDLTVSKYSDGTSIDDTTQVYVTWIAIGTESTSTSQAAQCTGLDNPTVDSSGQVTIAFSGVSFTNASKIKLSASVIVMSGAEGVGSPARIISVLITTTDATLTLECWNGASWVAMAQDDIVQVSWTALEQS